MAGKYTFYAQLAEETAGRITASREAWKGFLTTSARLYKWRTGKKSWARPVIGWPHRNRPRNPAL